VPTFPPGLIFPRAPCYNPRQCTAAVAAMPLVVKLLLLGEGIVGKVLKRKGDMLASQFSLTYVLPGMGGN